MAAISSSNTAFALELFRTLSHANPSENVLVSPLSIRSALAMVYLGARGDTAAQMAQALSFQPGEAVHAEFKKLIEDINSPSKLCILKTANRLYGEKTALFLPRFLEETGKYYHSDLKTVDFIGAAEPSRKEINTWVEQQTENKIKDLLKTVSDGTRLVLVNALYLKLEKELTLEMLNEWTNRDNMDEKSEIIVHLPKFKLEEDYDLKEPLSELAMTDVFSPSEADLSGMNGRRDLFLSEVAHKAFMEVNEEGIEAAAATAALVNVGSSMLEKEEPFTADHPLIFFIRHNKTKSILFLGRFSSPQ